MKNKQLFEQYITTNIDNAYRFAFTYTKNKEDAEDIVTQSVIKALNSIDSLRNPSAMKSWFYKIIANTALSFLRSRNKVVFLDYETMTDTTGKEDEYSYLSFDQMIENLDVTYKTVIVLKYLEDMTLSEIAATLDLNENTVKSRLYRGLKMLKSDMEVE